MPDTLPKALTDRLLEFCGSISSERPSFITSRPPADAVLDHCFDNVRLKISRAGGGLVYGWAIWQVRGLYFEAVHHGVWSKRSGQILDVSPQVNSYNKILFLSDPSAFYDPLNVRDSLFGPDSDDPVASEFVSLARRRTALYNSYRPGGAKFAFFSSNDRAELDHLTARMTQIMQTMPLHWGK